MVLVGGSVRIPLVTQMLGHDLGRPVTLSPSPKHAVALGAALVAGTTSRPGAVAAARGPHREPATGEPTRRSREDSSRRAPVVPSGQPVRPVQSRTVSAGRPAPSAVARLRRLRVVTAGLAATAVLLSLALPLLLHPSGTTDGWQLEQVSDFGSDGVANVQISATSSETPTPNGLDVSLLLAGTTVGTQRLDIADGGADLELSALRSSRLGDDPVRWLAGPVRLVASVPNPSTASDTARQVLVWPEAPHRAPISWLWVLLLLFVAAYAESLLRGIRRRRRARPADVLGMSAVGVLAGVWLVLAGWIVSGLLAVKAAPLLAALVVVLLTGAGAGLAVLAGDRAARRRTVRRGP